jgi:hypothetical protein
MMIFVLSLLSIAFVAEAEANPYRSQAVVNYRGDARKFRAEPDDATPAQYNEEDVADPDPKGALCETAEDKKKMMLKMGGMLLLAMGVGVAIGYLVLPWVFKSPPADPKVQENADQVDVDGLENADQVDVDGPMMEQNA